ncbi:MAG: hypothetical protein ACLQNV_15355 [Steroidobacteraceae bacterium]
MIAIVSAAFIGEHLNLLGWIGIVTLAAGVLLLSARGGRDIVQLDRRAVGYALLTALTIWAYSVTDGIGVRLSRNPLDTCNGCSSQTRSCSCPMRCGATGAA